MITVRKYDNQDKEIWNEFNRNAKKHLFMFDRDYMDYHKDRFVDHSLMFFEDDCLIAIMPMNESEERLYSHGGLTYGGLITGTDMKQKTMNDIMSILITYAKKHGYKSIVYKTIPHFFSRQAAEEDVYSLYAAGAKLVTVDASTFINLEEPLPVSKLRKRQIAKASKEHIAIYELTEEKDFEEYIELQNKILSERHNTRAVHSGKELKKLHDSFPDNIHLIVAKENDRIIAGTVVYEYNDVIHTQYMAADDRAKQVGALDKVLISVIEKYRGKKKWLDFGISTEHNRIYLNEGLINQKETFGGRTGVYTIWEINM